MEKEKEGMIYGVTGKRDSQEKQEARQEKRGKKTAALSQANIKLIKTI